VAVDRSKVEELLFQVMRKSAWNFIRRATPEQLRLMREAIDKRLGALNGQDPSKV
jgi:hypothetical protein